MSLPWFRLYTEMVDDEKIRLLAFEDRWHYVALLCCKGSGLLDAGDTEAMLRRKLCVKLGLALRELEAMADRLAELGLIDAATFQPVSWESRQFKSDSSNARVKAFRERQAKKQAGNVSVTAQDTDTDLDTEKASRIGALKANGKGQSETPLEAAIAHALHVYSLTGNTQERDEAIAEAKRRHGMGQDGKTAAAGPDA